MTHGARQPRRNLVSGGLLVRGIVASYAGPALAVATGEADVALGSGTGGSIRIPAACCGITGLKTSYGRVPLDGVRPLAPSLDTVGPMAATIDGLVTGMALLEPATIYFTEAWDANQSLVQAHPDGVGDDIRQMLSMTDLFRPGLEDARSQLAA